MTILQIISYICLYFVASQIAFCICWALGVVTMDKFENLAIISEMKKCSFIKSLCIWFILCLFLILILPVFMFACLVAFAKYFFENKKHEKQNHIHVYRQEIKNIKKFLLSYGVPKKDKNGKHYTLKQRLKWFNDYYMNKDYNGVYVFIDDQTTEKIDD